MFYKKGIDITNDKQMFNFLKNHFTYSTMNSWNRLESIANNVKLHKLSLSGDWGVAYDFLNNGEYATLTYMIEDWEAEHPGYRVGFNGRSGGYLVLYNKDNNRSILSDEIDECEDYEEYKRYCREYYGSVRSNRSDLVFYTKLVQDFDKLCDELRNYVDQLSTRDFAKETVQEAVDYFNANYYDDLVYLNLGELTCVDGMVWIREIREIKCLYEAFLKFVDNSKLGYTIKIVDHDYLKLV